MSRELIERWFKSIPEYERDLPIVIHNGIAYTPRMILDEVRRGSTIGKVLQSKIERGSFGTTPEEARNLAIIRLRQVLSRYPPDKPIIATLTFPPRTYTPSELIREIESGSRIGNRFIDAEINHVKRLVNLR